MEYAYLINLILFFLIIIQSIAGVGVLVIGTPMLLILNIEFIEILKILLPVSICTSLLNLVFFKINKNKYIIKIDRKLNIFFFIFCLPFIFGGLSIIKNYNELINFKYLVSGVIFFSLIFTNQKKFITKFNDNLRILFLCLIGTIHGLSNSGGSLLSLFLSSNFKKNQSRYNITYFYFFLALFQFIMFLLIFKQISYGINFINLSIILIAGVVIGNILSQYINENNFKIIINVLCGVTCIVLLIQG